MADVFGQLAQVFMRFPAGKGFVVYRSDEGTVTGVLQGMSGSLSVGVLGEAAHNGQEGENAAHARKYAKGQGALKPCCTFASHSFHHAPQPF